MVNKQKGGSNNRGEPQTPPSNQKRIRGILNLAHTFVNKYVSSADQSSAKDDESQKWVRRGAIAAIAYTVMTAVIMIVGIIQAGITRDAENKQLRSYFSVEKISVECCMIPNEEGPPVETKQLVRVSVKNGGQTPGSNVRVRVGEIEIPFLISDTSGLNFDDPVTSKMTPRAPFSEASLYMLPGATKDFSAPINPVHVMRALARMSRLIIYGHIEAIDVFGDRRVTDFCQTYSWSARHEETFTACPDHNNERPGTY